MEQHLGVPRKATRAGAPADEDLPKDFEARRPAAYASLRKPLDPAEFSGALREEMTAAGTVALSVYVIMGP